MKTPPSVERARPRAARRCPADWQPTPEQWAKIEAECPGVDIAAETRKFRDHEYVKPKTDWDAAWRNWLRGPQAILKKGNGYAPRPTRYEELMARIDAPAVPQLSDSAKFLLGTKQ